MSTVLKPIVVVKAASGIPFETFGGGPDGALDIHSFDGERGPITSGLYKVKAGSARTAEYTYAESKIVLAGEIGIFDHSNGIQHVVKMGDFVYLPVGAKVDFSSPTEGLAFYVVTRDLKFPIKQDGN